MINHNKTCAFTHSVLLAALLSFVLVREGQAALPPAPPESESAPTTESPAVNPADVPQQPESVPLPIRLGGRLTYDFRGNEGDWGKSHQQGLIATLNASADVPVWEPWFGRASGDIGFHAMQTRTHYENDPYNLSTSGPDSSRDDTTVTGKAQLSLLPVSRTPFEAHYYRSDSRVSGTLSALDGYISERVGFTQNYQLSQGNSMLGWDRNTQTSAVTGEDRQDILQLALTQNIGQEHTFRLNGNRTLNTHEGSDAFAEQNGLYTQHTYRPDETVTADTAANISQSRYNLGQVDSNMRQVQLNSYTVWRPADRPYTMNGGIRLMSMENSMTSALLGSNSTRMNNINANAGAAYNLDRFSQLTASANVNQTTMGGYQNVSTSEMAGASYRPDTIMFGNYQYAWTAASAVTNRAGGTDAGNQLMAQLSHSLNRTIEIGQGSSLNASVSQAVAESRDNALGSATKLTHTGSLAWSAMQDGSMQLVQLSASDVHSWGANPGVFQLINFQATSNMATDRYSSWTGNLTVQAIRQVQGVVLDPNNQVVVQSSVDPEAFITTSSGSLSYQNQRAFGVSRLRFMSDLRINSQALMPMLGGPQDQESASWDNRLDYVIGRAQLRVNTRVSKIADRTNRAFMITITRDFGGA